jgi:hypothetical protein
VISILYSLFSLHSSSLLHIFIFISDVVCTEQVSTNAERDRRIYLSDLLCIGVLGFFPEFRNAEINKSYFF